MAVKCVTEMQKKCIAYAYTRKTMTQKELAENFEVSERTINRVLVEVGLATPVARIKGEAYSVMQLLKKYQLDLASLTTMLERKSGSPAFA